MDDVMLCLSMIEVPTSHSAKRKMRQRSSDPECTTVQEHIETISKWSAKW